MQLFSHSGETSSLAVLMKPAHWAQPTGGLGSTKRAAGLRVVPAGLQSAGSPLKQAAWAVAAGVSTVARAVAAPSTRAARAKGGKAWS